MSAIWFGAAWHVRGLTRVEKLVLLKLADNVDDDGRNAFPSVETIASLCEAEERAVRRALKQLRAVGLAVIEEPASRYAPTTYRLRFPDEIWQATVRTAKGGSRRSPEAGRGDNPRKSRGDISRIRGDISNTQGGHSETAGVTFRASTYKEDPSGSVTDPCIQKRGDNSHPAEPSAGPTPDAWARILDRVQSRVNRHRFFTWFRPTYLIEQTDDLLRVHVDDLQNGRMIVNTSGAELADACAAAGCPGVRIEFVLDIERVERAS
jgi:hypothetical protein